MSQNDEENGRTRNILLFFDNLKPYSNKHTTNSLENLMIDLSDEADDFSMSVSTSSPSIISMIWRNLLKQMKKKINYASTYRCKFESWQCWINIISRVHRAYDYSGPFGVLWLHMAWYKNCVKKIILKISHSLSQKSVAQKCLKYTWRATSTHCITSTIISQHHQQSQAINNFHS